MTRYVDQVQSKPDCNVHFSDLLVLQFGFVTKNRPQSQQQQHQH